MASASTSGTSVDVVPASVVETGGVAVVVAPPSLVVAEGATVVVVDSEPAGEQAAKIKASTAKERSQDFMHSTLCERNEHSIDLSRIPGNITMHPLSREDSFV